MSQPPRGYTDHGLADLIRSLSIPPRVRIGILTGTKPARGMGPTNAEIGAAHEYGAPKRRLPARSWLRAPLIDLLDKEIAKRPALARKEFRKAASEGSLASFMSLLGVLAESIVRLGFTNDGYGKWRRLKPKYAARKTVNNILVETTQLRESVTHVVIESR